MKRLQNLICSSIVLISMMLSAQTQSENYVKTTVYQTEVLQGQEDDVLEDEKIETINYFDGLGRAKQSIAVRAGGQGQSTNILDWTNDWSEGSGSTPLFNQNGQTSENQRIYGKNPFGEHSLLWRCGNDAANDADGGWNTDYFAVDKNVSYRYTVWVKRTGSQSGRAYHGTQNVNNLNGSANNNPYFFNGYLPQLNQWYLLVGVIHPHTYTGSNSGLSGVYDINGNKVKNGNDFKWRNSTNTSRFRNYLYYSTNVNTRQYFWNPVLIQVDDNQQPVAQFIAQSKPKDIITHYSYDDYGRQLKEHLPYASAQTQNGSIYSNPLAAQQAFYNTPKYQNTTNPYSESVVEKSPLNRVLKQAAPGSNFVSRTNNNDHTIKIDRKTNLNNDGAIVEFRVDFHQGNTELPILVKVGNYPQRELFVTVTKDENWKSADGNNHTTREYKDKLGRVILKRTYAPVGTNPSVAHDTYYVYDSFGNLTFVIPPKVVVSNGVSPNELNHLCYQYKYDDRNRLVEKKIPGKRWEYIVYNKLDQPVLTQDANQKNKREWLFTKYDAFGRVAYTGLHLHPSVTSRITMQGYADGRAYQWVSKTGAAGIAGTTIYYNNTTIPSGIHQIYTINYYDNYTFDRDGMNKPSSVFGKATSNKTKGLPTGTKVRILGTSYWTTTVMGYDDKGQVIWTGTRNDYLGTTDIVEILLDFTGKPEKTRTTHTKDGKPAIVTTDTFTYDHMGRLLTQKQQIGNGAEEMIAHNIYDELGQLERKKVGNAEQAPLQTVDYTYNVRGWLTGINDVNNIGDDLFTFKIAYDNPIHINSTPLYNGNISETYWKTANDNQTKMYGYKYDALNRFTEAINRGPSDFSYRFEVKNISYDKNGNILTLHRNGFNNANYVNMDVLSYTYDYGNKLLKVTETGNKNYGFTTRYSGSSNHYSYDANGNMLLDRNKGISSITYNHLNLPNVVSISNNEGTGNISYIYDAAGAKMKKIATEGSSVTTTEYAGNYVYKDGKLEFISHPEGYIEPNTLGSYDYIYQYKDQVNNVRLTYSDKDGDGKIDVVRNNQDVDGDGDLAHEILHERNFYPFGLQHKGYNNEIRGVKHNYETFQDQEFTEDLGLNVFEWKYRVSDPAIGRFWQVDPLAEKYNWMTTYQFSSNQPIHAPELEGLESSNDLNFKDPNLQNLTPEEQESFDQGVKDGAATGLGLLTLFTPGPDELLLGGLLRAKAFNF